MAAGCDLQTPLILTDQDVMLELMKHNVQLNELEDKATAMILDWYVLICACFPCYWYEVGCLVAALVLAVCTEHRSACSRRCYGAAPLLSGSSPALLFSALHK